VDSSIVKDLVSRSVRSIHGLAGYIGFDLIQLDDTLCKVVICEINPRLTTSFLGYRALTDENLAERLLRPAEFQKPIAWKNGPVSFTPDGNVKFKN
jgi:predicted ATP-grasp superfamily ATP-dependent carboligase